MKVCYACWKEARQGMQEEEEEEERLVARSLWSRSSVRLLLLHPPTHPLATPTSSTANPSVLCLKQHCLTKFNVAMKIGMKIEMIRVWLVVTK